LGIGLSENEGGLMDKEAVTRLLMEAVESVVSARGGAYVAGPLASGRRYYELLSAGQGEAASKVRQANAEEMRKFVASLRIQLPYPVIDPGIIKIEGWTSQEIGNLYLQIIEYFVKEIWFMDGWQYSRGATKEFQFAISRGISCLNSLGAVISADDGCRKISEVITYLGDLGIQADRFADRLAAIKASIESRNRPA
jgi:hypothetical protein